MERHGCRRRLDDGQVPQAHNAGPSRHPPDRLLERAASYDADQGKPYIIAEIVVFGSYLRPEVAELGDLDLAVALAERRPGSAMPEVLLDYAYRSGRRSPHIVAAIGWAQSEVLQLRRNRSGYINVHTEDISKITDSWKIVYTAFDAARNH